MAAKNRYMLLTDFAVCGCILLVAASLLRSYQVANTAKIVQQQLSDDIVLLTGDWSLTKIWGVQKLQIDPITLRQDSFWGITVEVVLRQIDMGSLTAAQKFVPPHFFILHN